MLRKRKEGYSPSFCFTKNTFLFMGRCPIPRKRGQPLFLKDAASLYDSPIPAAIGMPYG